jgi:hypothetical protein
MIKKIEKCPKCGVENPILTLTLLDPAKYEDKDNIPGSRVFELVCMECGSTIDCYRIENTIIAMKEMRDEMDKHYGQSTILPMI